MLHRRRGALTGLILLIVALLSATASAEKVRLRLTVWDGDKALTALRGAVEEFEAKHPDIDVSLESIPYGEYFRKLLIQYAGGVAPDVVMMNPEYFQNFARRGAMLPLNEFFDDVPGFDINSYYRPITEAMSLKGQVYVLPRDIAPIAIVYYNKDLFDQDGVPYPPEDWTWDYQIRPELRERDFLWMIDRMTRRDRTGRPTRYGVSSAWPGALLDTFIYSAGGGYANDRERPTELLYTHPATVKAHELMQRMMLKDRVMPSPAELTSGLSSTGLQLFLEKRVAMYVTGIWEVPMIRETLVKGKPQFFEWDIQLVPAFRDGTRATPTGGSGYSLMSSTKHPKEAWLLATWMAGEPGMMAMAKAGIAQPAIESLAQQEPWIPGPNTPADQQYPANRIITHKAVPHVVFSPTADYWQEVAALAGSPIEQIWLGTETPAKALERGQQRAETRLNAILADRARPPFNWGIGVVLGIVILGAVIAWVYWPERGVRYSAREKLENRVAYFFLMPWVLGMIIFTIGPMVLSILMSLAAWDVITPAQWRGFDNFREAFAVDPTFYKSLTVTTIYTLVAVPLGLIGSLLLALLLNVKVRGIPLFRTFFYLPSLASAVAASLIWRRIFQQEGGLLNSVIYGPDGNGNFLGLATALQPFAPPGQMINWLGSEQTSLPSLIIMSLWGVGGGIVILLAGLQGIPTFYYEAATLDGAGPWARFKAVTFPLLTPALFFSMITGFIGSFQVFTQSFVMTGGGPNESTRFFMLHLYDAAFRDLRMGYASALAWVLFAVILLFTIIQLRLQKYVYYEAGTK